MLKVDSPVLERTSRDSRPDTMDLVTEHARQRHRALSAPFVSAKRRPQRPMRSVRFVPCIAASIKAQRNHGEPRLVIRPSGSGRPSCRRAARGRRSWPGGRRSGNRWISPISARIVNAKMGPIPAQLLQRDGDRVRVGRAAPPLARPTSVRTTLNTVRSVAILAAAARAAPGREPPVVGGLGQAPGIGEALAQEHRRAAD